MNIRTSVFRGAAILSLTALGLAACEGKDQIILPTETPAVEVTVAPTQVQLTVGQTATAGAVVKNSTNQTVSWACSNTAVATVTAAGVITAVAPGSTVCTATSAADATAKGLVSVTVVPATITLSVLPTTATINSVAPGNTIQLATTVSGSTNQAVTCVSSASGVATVANGLVTAVAPGTAVITCTSAADANVKAAAVITVVAPTPPTVTIVLQPATATVQKDGTVQMVAIVSGSTNQTVSYATSDATVATVGATTGLVTGVKAGTAVITATAAADPTKKATAVITVTGAPPEPSISIASVVSNGSPVNPASIAGQVDATVNVSAVPENDVRAVVVLVDNIEVCRQNFTTPLGTTQGVATINCPVNTAAIDSTVSPWAPQFANGEHTFYARALNGTGTTITEAQFCPVAPAPGQPCKVVFNNTDFAAIRVTFDNAPDPNTALDQNGMRWNGGDVIATVHPILYSGRTIASLSTELSCDEFDDSEDLELVGGAWTYTWDQVDDVPGTYEDCTVSVGEGLDATGLGISFDEESASFNLDNEAPYRSGDNVPDTARYVNDSFTFSVTIADLGVDRQAANTVLQIIDDAGAVVKTGATGVSTINAVGLAESATRDAAGSYRVQATVKDALGNTATFIVPGRFGVDRTLPTLTVTPSQATGKTNVLPATFTFTFLDTATPPAGPSGFPANPVTVTLKLYNAQYPNGVCLDPLALTTTVRAGDCTDNVSDPVTIPVGTEGYYVFSAFVTDAAGNVSPTYTWTTLYDVTAPTAGNLVVPSVVTGGTSFAMSAQVMDNVELGQVWSTIIYSGGPYALTQQKDVIGTYGVPLLATEVSQLHTVTVPYFIRSISPVAVETNLPTTTVYTPQVAEYAIVDVAGVQLKDVCPALTAADGATTQNCMVRKQDITAAYTAGNPTGVTTDWTTIGTLVHTTTGDTLRISRFYMDAATGSTIDAVITGPAQTFNNPFPGGVYFYAVDAQGRATLLGQGSVGVTDNTITAVRTWRYTFGAYPVGTTSVFALGLNGTTGDALVTQTETKTINPPT